MHTHAHLKRIVALLSLGAIGDDTPAQTHNDDLRAIIAEMHADAETRTSLLADAATAGHNGKSYFLQSTDDAFKLQVRGQVQFRYLLDFRDSNDGDGDGAGEDDFESGFQTRRTKLAFEGHLHEPSLYYRFNGAMNAGNGDFHLEDAYAGYKWSNGLSLQWGQFKMPFLREENTSSAMQLAVERSIVNDAFSLFYSQGVRAMYERDDFRVALAFNDGAATFNSEFSTPRSSTGTGLINRPGRGESDYGVTGRVEFKPFGKWAAFQDFTSPAGSDYALLIGAAGHVEGGDSSSSAFTTGTYEYASWVADITAEGDGWNIHIAGVGGYTDYNGFIATGADESNDDYGLIAQGGFLIPNTKIEPFIRYAGLFTDPDRTADGADTFGSLTLGMNYYLFGHAAKFTADAVWYIDQTDPLVTGRTGHGQLGDDDAGEVTLRLQWQLLF